MLTYDGALKKASPAVGGPRFVVAEFSLKNADATKRVPPRLGRKPDVFYKATWWLTVAHEADPFRARKAACTPRK
jgi:hypothetical protein